MNQKSFHIIRYKDITNWSVLQQGQHEFGFSDRYRLIPIGRFLMPNNTRIEIKDNVEYKQLTVRTMGGGVYLRCLKKGKDIGTKQQWQAHNGQFILSKIDARNGAMGVISTELDGAIVTHDFPLFDINTEIINPQYLLLVITTKSFMDFAQSCSSGTTNRQRINVKKFLQQRIPLPSLEEQNELIEIYNSKIKEAELKRSQSINTSKSINHYLTTKLGLSVSKMEEGKGLKSIHFKDITRWDYQFYKNKKQIASLYKLEEIGTLLCSFMVGPDNTSIRCNTSDTPDQLFSYIGMENVEKESGVLLETKEINGYEVKSQTLRVPKDYIIYGKLRPYLNKYWMNDSDKSNIVCSSEFFVFDVKKDINKNYFLYMLASSFTQEQISDRYSGARMPRINETVFKSIQMPIPPKEIQQEIVDYIFSERSRAMVMKEQAISIREQAKNEFEKQIFIQC